TRCNFYRSWPGAVQGAARLFEWALQARRVTAFCRPGLPLLHKRGLSALVFHQQLGFGLALLVGILWHPRLQVTMEGIDEPALERLAGGHALEQEAPDHAGRVQADLAPAQALGNLLQDRKSVA